MKQPRRNFGLDVEKLDINKWQKRTVKKIIKKVRSAGVMRGLLAALRPDSVCVDCGAHYGEEAELLGPTGATVHCFEPDPHSVEILRAKVGHLPNVHIHEAAVAAQEGELKLFRNSTFEKDEEAGSSGSTVVQGNVIADEEHAHIVKAIDFVQFIKGLIEKHGRVDFLKMDIEGAEVEVLEAMIAADVLKHIKLTVVEHHSWLFPEMKARYAALHDISNSQPELNLFLDWS